MFPTNALLHTAENCLLLSRVKHGTSCSIHSPAIMLRICAALRTRWPVIMQVQCGSPAGGKENSCCGSDGSIVARLSYGSSSSISVSVIIPAGLAKPDHTERPFRATAESIEVLVGLAVRRPQARMNYSTNTRKHEYYTVAGKCFSRSTTTRRQMIAESPVGHRVSTVPMNIPGRVSSVSSSELTQMIINWQTSMNWIYCIWHSLDFCPPANACCDRDHQVQR